MNWKRIALRLIFFAGICYASAENLVKNGDFETDLSNWHWEKKNGKPGESLAGNAYSGGKYLKFYSGKNQYQYFYQTVGMVPGKKYELTLAVKCEQVPKQDFRIRFLTWKKDSAGKNVLSGWVAVPRGSGVNELIRDGGTHDWKTHRVLIPGNAIPKNTIFTMLYLERKNNGTGVVLVDSIKLEEADEE